MVEAEVRKWVKRYAAHIGAARSTPKFTTRVSARAQADRQRVKLEEEHKVAEAAMARLVLDSVKNPNKCPWA